MFSLDVGCCKWVSLLFQNCLSSLHLTLRNVWFNALFNRKGLGSPAISTLIHSNWFPMRSLSRDALGQPPYSQLSSWPSRTIRSCKYWFWSCRHGNRTQVLLNAVFQHGRTFVSAAILYSKFRSEMVENNLRHLGFSVTYACKFVIFRFFLIKCCFTLNL